MKKLIQFSRYLLLGLVILAGVSKSSFATDYKWTGATSSDWATTTNWTPNGNPGSGTNDNVSIGVTAFSGSQPTLSVAPAHTLISLIFGNTTPSTLTLSSPLTVNGLTLICGSTSGSNLIGTGTLTLGGDVTVADAATGTNGATISCPVALGTATRTFTVPFDAHDPAGTDANGALDAGLTISGLISGSFGITKDGLGKMVLTAANTYTGITTVKGGLGATIHVFGILNIQNAQALGSTANGTVVENFASLQLHGGITFAEEPLSISGEGGTNSGGALYNENGSNTWQGPITVNWSTTRLNSNGYKLTISGTIDLNGHVLILQGGSSNSIVTGIISGAGTLRKDGGVGTWIIAGDNDFTANVVVMAGTLSYSTIQNIGGGTSNLGAPTNSAGGTIILANKGTLKYTGSGSTSDRVISLYKNDGYDGATVEASGTGSLTLTGGITGNEFGLILSGTGVGIENGIIDSKYVTKNGSGTWRLSGANTYIGATTINAGTVQLGNPTALGTTASGTLLVSGAVLDVYGTNYSNLEDLTINGFGITNAGAVINSSATPGTYAGLLTLGSSSNIVGGTGTIDISNAGTITGSGFNLTLGGAEGGTLRSILGTGSATLTKVDAGAWTLSGTSTFTGGTTLNAGTLNINNSQALGTTAGTFTINGGAIDNTSGVNLSTVDYPLALNADFAYNGSIPRNLNLGAGATTLSADRQITVSAGTLTFGGIINDNSKSLTKAGPGTLSFGDQAVTLKNLTINTLGGTLISTSGNMNLAGNFSNNNAFTHNSGTVNLNGSVSQTIGGSSSTTFNNLTINNSSTGVTLNSPESVAGILTLTNGLLHTTTTNLMSVTNTITGAITGGKVASFIDGPVKWSIGIGNYVYPVGKNIGHYFPFTLNTSASSSPVITVEAFDTDAGAGATFEHLTMSSISHTEYWKAESNSGTFTGKVSLTRIASLTIENLIGKSPAQGGTYVSIGGTASSPSIINSNDISSLSYFVMGRSSYISITNIAGSPFCVGSAVSIPFEYSPSDIFDGSTFTAQLSNASGSFSSPVSMGTILSDLSGSQTINTTIPISTAAGSGYRIRVVSNSPAITGSDNGSDIIINTIPSAPSAGNNSPLCEGSTLSLTASSISGASYSWTGPLDYHSTSQNPTVSTYASVAMSGDYIVSATVNNCPSSPVTTTVNVVADPSITTQPATPTTECIGGAAQLSVTATGGTPSLGYQWYTNTVNSNTGGTLITGATSDTYTPPSTAAGTVYYYVIVSATGNGCGSATSNVAVVNVVADPSITTQPATPTTECIGGTAQLSVTATGGTPSLGYQWYTNTENSNTGGSLITGATSDTYTPPSTAAGTVYYYVIVSATGNGCGSATSNVAVVNVVADPSITTQPATPTTECIGGTAQLSVTATGGTPSLGYQWYTNTENSNTGGSLITGATSDTYTPPSTAAGTVYYYVIVSATGNGCGSATSNVAVVNVVADPSITTQPATPTTECIGGTAQLSVTATGGTPSLGYQWYTNTENSNTGGSLITGATSDTYTPPSTAAGTVYYYVIVSATGNGCGSATSNVAVVNVVADPSITTQPATPTTECIGGTAQLSVTATGGTPSLGYQWYTNTVNSNTGGTLITGATSDTYTPPSTAAGTVYYYVIVSATGNGCGSATSNVAVVNVVGDPSITTQPATPTTECIGGTAQLSVTATGGTPSLGYQWYTNTENSNTGGSLITGATSDTYTPPSTAAGTVYYYVIVSATGNGCGSATSNVAVVNVVADPSITTQPATPTTECIGGTAQLSVTATGGTPSLGYQWYTNTVNNNTGGTLITGATSDTYTPPSTAAGTVYYYVIVSATGNGCGSATSNVAVVNVVADPSITTQPATPTTECIGGTAQLSVTATGGTPSLGYQWYTNTVNSNTGGSLITGATSNTYTPPSTAAGTVYYYVIVSATGNGCGSATSNVAVVNVVADPSITTQPATPTTECIGGTAQLSVTATGGTPSLGYQWYTNTENSNTGGSLITGATSDTYTPPSTAAGTVYYYVIVSATGNGCGSATSNVAVVNVVGYPQTPTQSIDCSQGFNNAVITLLSPTGNGLEYGLDNGPFQTLLTFSNVNNGSHTITVRNSTGCTTTGNTFQVSCGCVNGPALQLSSNSGSTSVNTPVTISGNTFGGSATEVTITENGAGLIIPTSTSTSPFSFTYTPTVADAGNIVTITVTTNNPLGSPCAAAVVTYALTVNQFNTNPDINATFINVPVPGDVHTNDQVPSGVTYGTPVLVSSPSGSSPVLPMNPDGTYIFTGNLAGVYVYNVPVCVAGTTVPSCPTELLTITVEDVINPNPPVANTDIATTQQGSPVTLHTLANDAAGNPGGVLVPSSVTITTPPSSGEGTTSVDPTTGNITFTPASGFTGVVTYTYRVCDNTTPTALCGTAIQQVTVLPPTGQNSTEAADDYKETSQGVTLTVAAATGVLANDTDPQGNIQTVITTTAMTVSGKGTVTISANGSYVFVPVPGFTGPVSFVYTINDNGTPVASASATLHILVRVFNTNPDINATFINVPVPGDVHTNDQVPSGTTYGTPVLVSSPSGSSPVLTMNPDGTYIFTGNLAGVYVYNVPVCVAGTTVPSCPTELLTITVEDVINPNPPVANTDIATTQQGSPVTLHTLANDAAGNPGGVLVPSSVTITTPPSSGEGTTSVDPTTGNITFTPASGFTGVVTYTYRVCDNTTPTALCGTAIQQVTVLPPTGQNSTEAADDYKETSQGVTLTVAAATGVLANDTDPQGNIQTVITTTAMTVSGKGTVTISANGSYVFVPVPGFTGPVSFVYTINDNGTPVASASATLHILVRVFNTNPDINATFINVPVPGDVHTNDQVPSGTTYGTPVLVSSPSGSSPVLPMNPDGTYIFTGNLAGVYVYNVPVCVAGTTVPSCPTELLTITVEDAINPNPPVANTDIATTQQGSPVTLHTLANDAAGNPGGVLVPSSVTITTPPSLGEGTASVDPTTGNITFTPASGFTGVVTYTYRVCDNTTPTALCGTAIQQVTVLPPTGQNSTEAADDYKETSQGVTLTVAAATGVLANDTDPQGNIQTVITTTAMTVSGKGTVTISANGSYVFVPVPGFTGPVSFVYTINDNGTPVASASATLHILVRVFNTNPDINATFINVPVPGDVHTNDQVPSGVTYGTPVLVSSPSGSSPVLPMNPDGTYIFTGNLAGVYVYNVPVCVAGTTVPSCPTELLTITVEDAINPNPPVANTDIATTQQGSPVTLHTLANDAAGNPGGVLVPSSVTITTPPSLGEGTASVDPTTGNITFTPASGFTGVVTYTYRVCDNTTPTALCGTAIQQVTVLPPTGQNNTEAADDYKETSQGVPLTVAAATGVLANDTDPQGNIQTVITTTAMTVSGKGTVTISANGSYVFVPVPGFTGPVSFVYTINDNGTPVASASATLHILVTNCIPPLVTNTPLTQTICSGGSTTLVTLTSNVAGATLAWTATATAGVTGFAASGTGTIPVQTISTTGTAQGTVTYAITPTASGCTGSVTNYTVLVNPNPAITNTSLTQTICSGGSTTLVTLTSNVAGATLAWTATATAGVTGFAASGTGTIPVQTISTTGTAQGTVTYAITPTASGCTGSVTNYLVLVNPNPAITNTSLTQTICSGGSTTLVTLTSNVAGATLAWTATATAGVTGFAASGTGTIPVQTISTTGTAQGTVTYAITPTASGCTGSVTNYLVLVNPVPLAPTQTIDCSLGFGNAVITITNPNGAGFDYGLDGGPYQAGMAFTGVANGNHSISVRNASGCITSGSIFQVSCGCINGPTLALGSNSGSTCGTTPVTVNGNTFGGNATAVTIAENGSGSVNISSISTSPFAFTYTPLAGDAGNTVTITVTTNNPLGSPCAAAVATYALTVNSDPSVPIVSSVTQPTCTVPTGSVVLSGLPAGTWMINPGAVSGTGVTTSISGLVPGTYYFTVTNSAGCISIPSAAVVITAQPSTPAAPVIGLITQPTCALATGSVLLSGLPAGTWTINPGAIAGTGASTTITGLPTGSYNFTVINSAGCISAASATVVINTQPPNPMVPIVGAITQTTCMVATGSVVLSGLPSTGTWTINPGAITGTGTSITISGISAGTYNYRVTNSAGCVSAATANVVINAKPNCVPIAVNDTTTSQQDTPIKITVTTNDFDPDGTIDVTTVDLDPSTPGIQKEFTIPGQGTYTADNSGVVTVTPVSGYCGTVTPVGYSVNDNSGATSNIATINIFITCLNHPPVIDLPDVRTSGNTPVTICSPISDPDVEDTFTSSICGAPKHGSVTTAISSDGKNVCAVYTPETGFTGKDSICVTVCDNKGLCGSSTSVITVTLISLDLTTKAVTCTGSKDGLIGLTVSGGTAPYTFVWTGPGNFTASTEDISGLGGGSYSVKVTDAIGENKSASATVAESGVLLNLNTTPKAVTQKESVDGSVTLEVIGGSVELVVTGGTTPFIYDWTGPANFTATTKDLTNLSQGTYYVTVTDANSCIKTSSAIVDIQVILAEDDNCELFIPNVFTPNGDGVHDYFEIRCLYNYENPEVQIFNRNGNLVFKKDHYGNIDYWGSKDKAFWNGHSENNLNFMGSELPVGTYYYVLKLGSGKVYTGFVFLGR